MVFEDEAKRYTSFKEALACLGMNERKFRYQQYYCEENVWYLCKESLFTGLEKRVIFISNETKRCPLRYQRICKPPERPVWWDYHVILICRKDSWMVWDLDTLLGLPISFYDYVKQTFGEPGIIPVSYAPRFRVIDADVFRSTFSSNRSHMRTPSGKWIAPPPVWPPIINGPRNTLDDFLVTETHNIEEVLTYDEAYKMFAL